ncbi:ribosomal protein S6 modification protein [Aliiroseovarius zhejiangensis]|uniref:Ribosomal protein S6 modification protein n=1 Tax=Aliiroseovarius zhejiangensis TaxID=1632025 RepID=A0ABQ3IIT5_9RHOB|nr:RimK/LysX family protein [Aliiroseovarius zhejiangensis]GHE85735.1 ribosomal protein S6 modification protein [Aliiroseovarius zhejiangensis]
MTKSPPSRPPQIIGWREHIALPDFGILDLPAKVDTGARTTALHAVDQTLFERDGAPWVEFMVPLKNRRTTRRLSAPVLEERDIKNTGGVPERRLVVRTTLVIGKRHWLIDVSLANREKMEFDVILGRSAIRRHRLLVDPRRSYLAGAPVLPRPGQPITTQPAPRPQPAHRRS